MKLHIATTVDLTSLHKYGLLISGCSLTTSISRKDTYGKIHETVMKITLFHLIYTSFAYLLREM
jgi:hypothetical protein